MLKSEIEALGFNNVVEIKVNKIAFEPSLIDLCKQNSCGNYGKCYTCPPFVGNINDLIADAKTFDNALVVQKVYQIEDSYDIEGMLKGVLDFNNLIQHINELRVNLPYKTLLLGAGGCRICKKCGAVDNIPCRFPKKAIASLESYGINVYKLALACDINYINGQNTVTYFGSLFY